MPCLDENDVVAFLQGTLAQDRRPAIRSHLDSCKSCLELVSLLGHTSVAHEADLGETTAQAPTSQTLGADAPSQTSVARADPELESVVERELVPGTTVGRYEILEARGSGGMGVVYAARDPQLDRNVAIKLVRPSLGHLSGEQGQLRLLREAQAMARLTHPNVLTVHDIGAHGDQIFVAAELVSGQTLDRWLAGQHTWREIVEVFVQAGRGLDAAHRAGLVHRDFKPQNVLIGDDHRVRVFDFGLVQFGQASSDEKPKRRLVGTPAYMSPEQFRGEAGDHRTDQFGYCVSLFEALSGERPFAGKSIEELSASTVRGLGSAALHHGRIPAWLRRILARGLESSADNRHPSMSDLVDALNAGLGARKRRLLAAGAATALAAAAAAGVIGYWQGSQSPEDPCRSPGQLHGVWDAERRQKAERAFRDTSAPFATSSWQSVSSLLDDYADQLMAQKRDACLAVRVRKTQSTEIRSRRDSCIEQRTLVFGALVDRLVEADSETVQHAVRAASTLPRLELCARPGALAQMQFPQSTDSHEEIARAWRLLAKSRSLVSAGKLEDARADAEAALEAARASKYRPVEAEALYALGRLRLRLGEFSEATSLLEEAVWSAQSGGHDELVALGSAAVLFARGVAQAQFDETRSWSRMASAAAERTAIPRTKAAVARAEGLTLLNSGQFDAAEAELERAVQLAEAAVGKQHHLTSASLIDLANVYQQRGRLTEAEAIQRRAIDVFNQTVGPRHPDTGLALNNLGNTLADQGRYEDAAQTYAKALKIREDALGPKHPDVGQTLNNMSGMWMIMGEYEQADRDLKRSLEIRRAAVGDEHPAVARTLSNLGEIASAAGRVDDALVYHRQALAIREARLGPSHPETAISTYNLGINALERGELGDARSWCDRTRETLSTSDSGNPVFRAEALTCLGRIELAHGRTSKATALLQSALALYPDQESEPGPRGDTHFALAQALGARKPIAQRAVTLARRAVSLYQRAGIPYRNKLAMANQWLAERGIDDGSAALP